MERAAGRSPWVIYTITALAPCRPPTRPAVARR